MLECVINVSEGRDASVIEEIAAAAGAGLLDVHRDPHHHRSVLTMAGPDVEEAARRVVSAAVDLIDLRRHHGAHPRMGAADVVPFTPLEGSSFEDALAAREALARWAGEELGVPCFVFGPDRSLPDVRRHAFTSLSPDHGPARPHPRAGASAVGARGQLVAYNLWMGAGCELGLAKQVAAAIRRPGLRALGLGVGGRVQVSCNLVEPFLIGPGAVFDAVAQHAEIERAELVGLLPARVLDAIPPSRWKALDVHPSRTIEARLEQAGLDVAGRGGR